MEGLFSLGKSLLGKDKNRGQNNDGYGGNYGGGNYGQGGGNYGSESNTFSVLKSFDRDGDGQITENDFIIAVQKLGLGSIGEMGARRAFRKLDKNHNGRLDTMEAVSAIGVIQGMLSSGSR